MAAVIQPPTSHPVSYRQPLGMPAGSVRALLTFAILGLLWTLLLLPKDKAVEIPLYLYYLSFLALGHFFAAHGHSIPSTPGTHSPLYLPRGTLRILIVLGFLGVFGWRYYRDQDFAAIFDLKQPAIEQPYLPLVMLGGFLLGVIISRIARRLFLGPAGMPYWYQDLLAWLALLGTAFLAFEVVLQLVINPSLDPDKRISLPQWQMVLSAVVSFYFGARS